MSGSKASAPAEKRVEIAGMQFGISPVTGREGLRLLRRLSKSILPAVGGALVAINSGKTKEERSAKLGQVLQSSLPAVFADLTEDEMDALVDKLLANVVYLGAGGREEALRAAEIIFTGKTEALLRLLWASAGVCFADFFDGSLGTWARAVGAKMKAEFAKETEPTTETPPPST